MSFPLELETASVVRAGGHQSTRRTRQTWARIVQRNVHPSLAGLNATKAAPCPLAVT